jgi:hypothetical protein
MNQRTAHTIYTSNDKIINNSRIPTEQQKPKCIQIQAWHADVFCGSIGSKHEDPRIHFWIILRGINKIGA